MPRLHAISQGMWHHIQQQQQQQRPARQMQLAEPNIGGVPAQLSPMATPAPTRVRMVCVQEGENRTVLVQESPRIDHTQKSHSQQPHPDSEESHVRSAARLMHRSGRTALPLPHGALTNSEVAVCGDDAENGFHRRRERRPRLPSPRTSRTLEELFNEELIAEEQRVALLSAHQLTITAGEEDLFSKAPTRSYSSIVEAGQRVMAMTNASSRTTRRQCTVDAPLPTPSEASAVVRAVPHTCLEPLRVWLPRRVEALSALTCEGSPPITRVAASGDRSQARTRAGDGDDGFPVALWRRTPCSTPPRAGVAMADADGAPTSLLSSPHWCVTAYEPLSLSLPATARCADGDSEGPVLQQAPISTTTLTHLSSTVDSSILGRSGAREGDDAVNGAEDDEEAAAVGACRDHRPPTAMASAHGSAPTTTAVTRVYWGAAPPLRGMAPSVLHHGGASGMGADGDAGDAGGDGAAFAGRRSSGQNILSSVQGGARGYDGVGARPSRSSATAAVDRHEPFCELPSSLLPVMRRRPPAVPGPDACVPPQSMELRITLPWLLHTSTLPPVAAEVLARCLGAHIRAHLRPEGAAQWRQDGACRPRLSGTCAPGPAAARPQPMSSRRDDPPPCWVAAFAYTEGIQMYATNHAASLVHAKESTEGFEASRDYQASPRHDPCGLAPEAPLERISWPAWVPDAQTSVRMLAALTSGAFQLIEAIARALGQAAAAGNCSAAAALADMDTAEEGNTEARSVRRSACNAGGQLHIGGGTSRSSTTLSRDPATVLHQFHVFSEAIFGDAANKRLCRHVRDRLPLHVQDLSELLSRPWCGGAREDEDGDVATTTTAVAATGVWRARCPSMLDLVHHLARAWMAECFTGLANRLHAFLTTHDPGVVFDLISARANDSDDAVPHDSLCNCARLLKRMCTEECGENACAHQRGPAPARERHCDQRERHDCSVHSRAVPGAATAAASVLPPHALIYRGVAEFTHGPLQRWERWWWSPSSTPAAHSLATNTTASVVAMQWSTHVNYATVRSLQWVLRHPLDAHAVADGARQSASNLAAVTDMRALLELLTLMPPLLDTTALLMYEAEAVLRGACACVMGNAGDRGGGGTAIMTSGAHSHNAITTGIRATPSRAATQGFHAYYRVFLGLVCYGAMQLSDAEGMALLSRPRLQPTGVEPSTAAPHHRDAASPLPELRSAQATVDGLWTRYILPLVVGYVSGSGTGAAPAARMDALTAADQCITYALMLLQLLRLEGRSARHGGRGCAQNPALPNGAQQDVPNCGVSSSSRHRRKRARSSAVGGPEPHPWGNSRSAGSCGEDARPRWWAPSPTTADEHPATARSPRPESVSSSAFTADTATTTTTTATTRRCANSGLDSINELERVGATTTESQYMAAPAFAHAPRPGHRDEQSVAPNAASGAVDGIVGMSPKEQTAPSPHRIPPLELLAQGDAGEAAAAAATPQCPPCPAPPPDWQGVCRQLIRRWLQPTSDCHGRGCRASNFAEGAAQHPKADDSAAVRANCFPGGRSQLLDICEAGGGHTLHRRDVRRVGALLAGLALRVAAVREEEQGAHAVSPHSDGTGCCYDYLYGVLPPGLRARDAGLITVASTSSSDDGEDSDTDSAGENAETDDNPCNVNILHCVASTISTSSSSSNTLGTTPSAALVSPLSSSLSTSP
ncbi:PTP1-interacting protein 39 kDa [Leishmania donovani]|uniref:PTP1-interacting_protein_39_kDa_putative/GeneDB:L mjF.03.0420 n=1 Tax=Leishmania donovani TaxID=5661 RepID=A0A6J8F271_LEIDO|nr:PTP1-interacting protein 39 kDa [Leishmania donovani]VDZ41687.1 PTP1-interacting_protein_39_kDa_putative/GeneDB:LmjF.03.0420 [Leishmania donovani]